jgi:hypothetical protein
MDVLRLGDGVVSQVSHQVDVFRQGSLNAFGSTLHLARPPVRVRNFDLEAEDLSPNELPAEGAFVIEAEDYNFAGGQSIDAASVMPYFGGAFAGREAVSGVDYFNADGDVPNPYRPEAAPNVVNLLVNRSAPFALDRPGWQVPENHRVGSATFGDWQQYTRTIPAGAYWVWAALSHNGNSPGQLNASLDRVTGDPTQANPALESLGRFLGTGTGEWGRNRLVLLRDASEAPVVLQITPTVPTTLRLNLGSGDVDWFVLIPTNAAPR